MFVDFSQNSASTATAFLILCLEVPTTTLFHFNHDDGAAWSSEMFYFSHAGLRPELSPSRRSST